MNQHLLLFLLFCTSCCCPGGLDHRSYYITHTSDECIETQEAAPTEVDADLSGLQLEEEPLL